MVTLLLILGLISRRAAAAAADGVPPEPACPSTVNANSSFVPKSPFASVVGPKAATPVDCIAICCVTTNCSPSSPPA